jgi:hypothetical protein
MNTISRIETLIDRVSRAKEPDKSTREKDQEAHILWEELMTRHQRMEELLEQEVADLEAHGHHVSALERAILDWENYSNPKL